MLFASHDVVRLVLLHVKSPFTSGPYPSEPTPQNQINLTHKRHVSVVVRSWGESTQGFRWEARGGDTSLPFTRNPSFP